MDAAITYFDTYESREEAFGALAGHLIPCKYRGAARFWDDFRRITGAQLLQADRLGAAITSNPRDCLAFGSPLQVMAAAMTAAADTMPESLDRVAERFGLTANLNQPIRTLSGGETVKLALAKAWLAEAASSRLAIASPFSWLSQANRTMLDAVIERYAEADKAVTLMALDGEDHPLPVTAEWDRRLPSAPPVFDLILRDAQLSLGSAVNLLTTEPARVEIADFKARLTSPCLMIGNNGQGKSLLARALCGAIPVSGTVGINGGSGNRRARLLFQDVMSQTLLRSLKELAGGETGHQTAAANDLFDDIVARHADLLGHLTGYRSRAELSRAHDTPSLLEIKIMLLANRLAQRPAALILDEPDWGLTRNDAIALTAAVIEAAHLRQVPVVLISHKPWWTPLANAVVRVTKVPETGPRSQRVPFTIYLRVQPTGQEAP